MRHHTYISAAFFLCIRSHRTATPSLYRLMEQAKETLSSRGPDLLNTTFRDDAKVPIGVLYCIKTPGNDVQKDKTVIRRLKEHSAIFVRLLSSSTMTYAVLVHPPSSGGQDLQYDQVALIQWGTPSPAEHEKSTISITIPERETSFHKYEDLKWVTHAAHFYYQKTVLTPDLSAFRIDMDGLQFDLEFDSEYKEGNVIMNLFDVESFLTNGRRVS